jgi:beta propeller repeat protein
VKQKTKINRIYHSAALAVMLWIYSTGAAYTQTVVSAEPGHQGRADIWGDWVVWQDNRQGGDIYNIYAKNLSSGQEIQISNSNTAFCPSIYNNLVVWQDKRNGDFDIYSYDLVTHTESALYIAQGNQVNPAVYGDTVVWRTGQYPSWPEVWGYSISQAAAFLITDAPGNKWQPDVFADTVVWGDYRNGNWDIYGYDIAAQTEFVVADGPAYQRSAAIYENTIVYENLQNGENTGIGIYNLHTQEHAYHYIDNGCDWLDIYGSVAVWGDYRNKDTDIYGYKIFTGEEFSVANYTGGQYNPAIYRDTVVWSIDTNEVFVQRDVYSTITHKCLFVEPNASGNNDGATWRDAYNYLQDALAVASRDDDIFTASGTYRPDQGANHTPNSRSESFELVSGAAIWGGFAGGETSFSQRDLQANETILSGDIGTTDLDSDNSYHVVIDNGTNKNTVLDGFIITGGNADGSSYPDDCGGGLFIDSGSPTLTNCSFVDNSASDRGGGMYSYSGEPTFSKCTFSGNSAANGAGLYPSGGTISNCTIADNTAGSHGGGISSCSGAITDSIIRDNFSGQSGGALYNCDGSVTNCIINGNTAGQTGGGLDGCDGSVVGCTINDNYAEYYGGGLYDCNGSVINCSITRNRANAHGGGISSCGGSIINSKINGNRSGENGGALYNCDGLVINSTISGNYAAEYGGGLYDCGGSITNCIVWLNTADIAGNQVYSCSEPAYSCIQDWTGGVGNIADDPCFVESGYWADANDLDNPVGPNEPNAIWISGLYQLSPGSPCIDRGDDTVVPFDGPDLNGNGDVNELIPFDIDRNPRFVDDPVTDDNGVPELPAYPEIVDMGAYEYVLKIHNINQDAYQRTIQDAIDTALDGDVIVVYPGT